MRGFVFLCISATDCDISATYCINKICRYLQVIMRALIINRGDNGNKLHIVRFGFYIKGCKSLFCYAT